MISIRFTLTAFVLLLAGPAMAQDKVPTEAYARVNAALVENHVVPRYQRLAVATAALSEAAETFCSGSSTADLAAVRKRYHDAMDAWMSVQHLRFGPVELFMRSFRLYFWPEARGKVAEAVDALLAAGDDSTLAPEYFRDASVAVQGLPAIEQLLYGDDGLATSTARCRLLTAIASNMNDMSAGIVADWRGGKVAFAHTVESPSPDDPYFNSDKDATLAFFKSFHGGLQLIADVKLKPVVGNSIATAQPRLAESRPSGRALRNVVINLEALEALYLGEGGPVLSAVVRDFGGDPKLDPLMRKAFRMTLETARGIEGLLAEAVTDPARRPEVETLQTQVLALKQIVRTRLAAALDLQVGFNALDGD